MKQPEDLELADALDSADQDLLETELVLRAAAELRRLHEANQAMLEALKELKLAVDSAITCGDWVVDGACDPDACLMRVEAAIAKGEQQ